jgi:hypothetical protein
MAKNSELQRISALFRALDDSVRESSDQDVFEDLKALKIDPLKTDEQMKFAIEGAVEHFYADRLMSGRERECCSARYRELLLETLRDNNSAQYALESKFAGISNVQEWSDTEVLRAIQCLVVLGFIPASRANSD